eukprot:TRINITY_DN1300_c0_g6_i1.p1 TRINITY_DN1300_c0_g6~~TRINITY_DN1300_c0_g6_i1.p1  ORF type:complete len:468 (+),score=104.90 TRINITY_DN1300_c0_g6_i1:90-1493(+)
MTDRYEWDRSRWDGRESDKAYRRTKSNNEVRDAVWGKNVRDNGSHESWRSRERERERDEYSWRDRRTEPLTARYDTSRRSRTTDVDSHRRSFANSPRSASDFSSFLVNEIALTREDNAWLQREITATRRDNIYHHDPNISTQVETSRNYEPSRTSNRESNRGYSRREPYFAAKAPPASVTSVVSSVRQHPTHRSHSNSHPHDREHDRQQERERKGNHYGPLVHSHQGHEGNQGRQMQNNNNYNHHHNHNHQAAPSSSVYKQQSVSHSHTHEVIHRTHQTASVVSSLATIPREARIAEKEPSIAPTEDTQTMEKEAAVLAELDNDETARTGRESSSCGSAFSDDSAEEAIRKRLVAEASELEVLEKENSRKQAEQEKKKAAATKAASIFSAVLRSAAQRSGQMAVCYMCGKQVNITEHLAHINAHNHPTSKDHSPVQDPPDALSTPTEVREYNEEAIGVFYAYWTGRA